MIEHRDQHELEQDIEGKIKREIAREGQKEREKYWSERVKQIFYQKETEIMSIVGKWIGPDELLLYGMYIDNIVAFAAR